MNTPTTRDGEPIELNAQLVLCTVPMIDLHTGLFEHVTVVDTHDVSGSPCVHVSRSTLAGDDVSLVSPRSLFSSLDALVEYVENAERLASLDEYLYRCAV